MFTSIRESHGTEENIFKPSCPFLPIKQNGSSGGICREHGKLEESGRTQEEMRLFGCSLCCPVFCLFMIPYDLIDLFFYA